jgi:hypothetical protein
LHSGQSDFINVLSHQSKDIVALIDITLAMLVVLHSDFALFGDLALLMASLFYKSDFIYVALHIVALRCKHQGRIATSAETAIYPAISLVILAMH